MLHRRVIVDIQLSESAEPDVMFSVEIAENIEQTEHVEPLVFVIESAFNVIARDEWKGSRFIYLNRRCLLWLQF